MAISASIVRFNIKKFERTRWTRLEELIKLETFVISFLSHLKALTLVFILNLCVLIESHENFAVTKSEAQLYTSLSWNHQDRFDSDFLINFDNM